jgi:transposase
MIRGGFLSEEDRKTLVALARDNLAAGRVTRRANALVLLDDGLSCQEVAKVLLFDDDTIRNWHALFEQRGLEGLTSFDMGGSSSLLSAEQAAAALKAWVSSTLPKSTRQVGAWSAKEFGLVYESRSGLIALLHRLGLEYHKPEVISRKLDEKTQKAFIAHYDNTLNSMGEDEVAVFVDAVHTTHAARPVGCWAPAEGTEPRDRADERAPTHQHPWRGRPGNGQNPDDRGRNDRRDVDDPVVGLCG